MTDFEGYLVLVINLWEKNAKQTPQSQQILTRIPTLAFICQKFLPKSIDRISKMESHW